MKGYKIRYKLISQSGMDAPIGTQPVVLTFDKFTFEHEIKNLLPYAEYHIDVYGYANEGDGPVDTIIVRK